MYKRLDALVYKFANFLSLPQSQLRDQISFKVHGQVKEVLPWSQRFSFAAKRTSSDRQRSGERKPLVTRDVNLTIMLR